MDNSDPSRDSTWGDASNGSRDLRDLDPHVEERPIKLGHIGFRFSISREQQQYFEFSFLNGYDEKNHLYFLRICLMSYAESQKFPSVYTYRVTHQVGNWVGWG